MRWLSGLVLEAVRRSYLQASVAPFVIFALADLQSAAEPSLAVAAFVPEVLVDGSAAGGLAVVVPDCSVPAEG